MSSAFLDTLRKHELDQLSVQDYAALGITDISDRKKIFGMDHGQYTRMRRQSTVQMPNKPPSSPARPVRSRTMSDAGSSLPRCTPSATTTTTTRKPDLRRSVLAPDSFMSSFNTISSDEEEEDEQDMAPRRYRASAPMLNAYGMPTSSAALKSRRSIGALKSATAQQQSRLDNLPPSDLDQKIRVCVRKRPLNKKETERCEKDIAETIGTRSILINEPKLRLDLSKYIEQHTFTFDDVFDANADNNALYQRTALPLVQYIFQGGKATCFAYGQTGSGKTFTMLDPRRGLYVLAARDIFAKLKTPEYQHLVAWIGLYEIYQGQLYDLLNERKKLFAREDGKRNVIISGLKEYPINNVDNLVQVFAYGNQIRSTGSTGANDTSSRSHAVLQILLKPRKNRKAIHGKLSFIDLAGSERGADRGESDTKTRMEGAEINKSLLALKECIRALDQDKRHTPFRQSKLTQVLKDSFVGNSRTCMIATISPSGGNSEHTLNTLRYADRVKELKGERERQALKSNGTHYTIPTTTTTTTTTTNHTNTTTPSTTTSSDNEFDEDDYYLSNESDILDDEEFDADDDIFNVDFPHEQDALLNSSSYSLLQSSSQKPYDDHPWSNSSKTAATSSSDSSSPFDFGQMETILNLHRAQLRQVTECTKLETKLVGKMALELSSQEETTAESNMQFKSYLHELDEILEQKAGAVEALRDRINETVCQVPL
ncbi:kinesin-domain-containing protein [Lichtheimia hyalospora FSU 10163]|nr:kinesin-domain-containing protein [Lichtheimia hyalospora FSU 10163]